jgi:hypothetical protein
VAHLTTYLDLESLKIQRSGFDFKSNLTSAIGDLAKLRHLARYVSHHNAMAYDKASLSISWRMSHMPGGTWMRLSDGTIIVALLKYMVSQRWNMLFATTAIEMTLSGEGKVALQPTMVLSYNGIAPPYLFYDSLSKGFHSKH